MLRRALTTLEIARPHNMVAAALCVFSGFYLSGGRDSTIALAVVLTAAVTGLGNLINDFYDADIDRINKPRRPIPSHRLAPRYVRKTYLVGTILATAACLIWLDGAMRLLVLVWQALLFVYAWRGKRAGLPGNILVATLAASAFLGGAFATGGYRWIVFPAVMAFILVMARELIKGAEDVGGDSVGGARTVAVVHGVDRAVGLSVFFLLLCVVLAPIPAVDGRFGRVYVALMELLFVPGVLIAAYMVLQRKDPVTLNRAAWILKIQMFFGILAMTMGRTGL